MANQVEFVLDAKEAGAVRAWLAVQRAADQFNASLQKTGDIQEQNSRSGAEWQAKAKKLLADLEAPMERHNRKLAEYSQLRQRNLIDERQYADAVRKSKAELDGATKSGSSGLAAMGAKVGAMVSGFGLLTTAAHEFLQANSEIDRKAEEIADKYDVMFRRFQALTALSAIQGAAAKERILTVAQNRAVTSDQAEAAASAMASVGYSASDASGDALSTQLKIVNAQQMTQSGNKTTASDVAESSARYLASQDQAKSSANLERLGIQVQNLAETPLTFASMGYLSRHASGFKGKLTQEEQLSTFGILQDVMPAEQAGTSMRAIVSNLSTATATPDRKRAIERLKLKTEDVDMIGESFPVAMSRIEAGLMNVPESEREGVLKTIFEEANVSAAKHVMQNRERIVEKSKNLNDRSAFDAAVKLGETGPAAAARRQSQELERLTEKENRDTKKVFDEVELEQMRRGEGPFARKTARYAANLARLTGATPEEAATSGQLYFRNMPFVRGLGSDATSLEVFDSAMNSLESKRVGQDAPIPAMPGNLGKVEALLEKQNALVAAQLEEQRKAANAQPVNVPKGPRPLLPVQANDIRFKGQFLPPGDRP